MAHTDTIDRKEDERIRRFVDYHENDGFEAALTEDEQAAAEEKRRIDIVQALGTALLEKRREAMEARAQTGIEKDWEEDEEFYQSIDSANPEGETNVGKPTSSEGGAIGVPGQAKPARSSVFVPMTRPYVDAAAARIADMLLPNDDMPWSLTATPIPEQVPAQLTQLAQAAGAMPPAGPMAAMNPGPGAPAMPDMGAVMGMSGPQAAPQAMQPGAMNPAQAIMAQPAAVAASPTQESAEEKAAKEATKQITDWLIECQYHAEFRKMLENAAKLGTGILKGPIPDIRVSQKMVDGALIRVEKVVPITLSVDPRNFFPDPACGEDVQRGGYVWEYDTFSGRKVQDLRKDDSYIQSQLEKVIKEGPCKQGEAPANSPQGNAADKDMVGSAFGVWYFHGMVDKDTLLAAGVPEDDFAGLEADSLSAVITMINDTVVKAALSPLDMGGFPYDVMPWQRRAGMIWGMGVARQMRTAQRMVNAATRAMMDNAGFTSGPQWAIREGWIEPIDGQRTLTPRKGWRMTAKAPDNAKIGDAISFTNIQSAQQELASIIQMGQKMAEDATGLPMLMQGQQGDATDTAAGMTILNNNGSTVLRRIARQADDSVTERHIRRYYYWLLENSDNEAAKGDFQIDARGSTALVDRQISNQALVQMVPFLRADPDIHQGRLSVELMKANRIDWKHLMLTDAEKAERAKTPPPPPESVMVAQIKEAGATKRHTEKLQLEAAGMQQQSQLDEAQLQLEWETTLGDLSLKHGISRDSIKAQLAGLVMRLNAQTALSNADRASQVLQPAVEPAQRAPAGEAFAQ